MQESLHFAKEELKRADHLINVSLKYTRTVDVLKSIIERMINAYDNAIDALLKLAKEQKRIATIPELPRMRAETIKKVYDTPEVNAYIEFYYLLRKIDKSEFERAREYRRHVTMTAFIDSKEIEITIDIMYDYFEKIKDFIFFAEKAIMIEEEK